MRHTLPVLPCLLAATLAAGSGPLSAQTLAGTLRERETDRPIHLGRVVLLDEAGDSVASDLTDPDGSFSVTAGVPGSFLLVAAALGYRPSRAGIFDLGEDGRMSVIFRLAPEPVTVDGLLVAMPQVVREPTLVRNGFYDRMRTGLGRFLTPEEIETSSALRVADLFWGIPRVEVRHDVGLGRILIRRPGGACVPTVFLDGAVVSNAGGDLESFVDLPSIQAVEIYRSGAELPLQYGGLRSGCGALVVWTRVGR